MRMKIKASGAVGPTNTVPTPPSPEDPDDTWILRVTAAEILGVSLPTVRRLEKTSLPPVHVDDEGVHWHSLKAVQAYKARLLENAPPRAQIDGALTADAFALFERGADAAEIAVTLRTTADAARQLQKDWADLKGGFVVGGIVAYKIREMAPSGDPIETGEDLLRFARSLDYEECACCKRPATFCMRCFYDRPKKAREIVARAIAAAEARHSQKKQREATEGAVEQAREKRRASPAAPIRSSKPVEPSVPTPSSEMTAPPTSIGARPTSITAPTCVAVDESAPEAALEPL